MCVRYLLSQWPTWVIQAVRFNDRSSAVFFLRGLLVGPGAMFIVCNHYRNLIQLSSNQPNCSPAYEERQPLTTIIIIPLQCR